MGLFKRSVLCKLDELNRKVDKLMALADDLKASIANIDTETTAVGALVKKLGDEIHNGMTDTEVADIKSALSAVSDHLTAIAVDPKNPVPPMSPALQALKSKK